MVGFGIAFAPLVPAYRAVGARAALRCVLAVLLFVVRSRGAWVRVAGAGADGAGARQPVVHPRGPRAAVLGRRRWWSTRARARTSATALKQTEAARAALAERLGRIPNLDVRFVEAGEADGETDGTRLFAALGAALADVPPDRVAGAIFLTDGRVHDVPADAAALGFAAPVHAPDHRRPPTSATAASCW